MLSYLGLKDQFRSLASNTFSSATRFGRRTIIYGHNGSGKSSLSELLHQLANGQQSISLTWDDSQGQRTSLPPFSTHPNVVVSSFCKSWIQENIAEFLDGSTTAAIVVLGKTAKEAQELEKDLEVEVGQLEKQVCDARKDWEAAKSAVTTLVKDVQDSIVDTLGDVDHREYTKHRYNEPRVRQLLSSGSDSSPTKNQHDQNLKSLAQDDLNSLTLVPCPSPDWARLVQRTRELVGRSVESEVIEEILGNSRLQQWLEEGLTLHKEESSCQFCKSSLSRERLSELTRHFDESRRNVRGQVISLLEEIENSKQALETWLRDLPPVERLYPELTAEFNANLDREREIFTETNGALDALKNVLNEKFDAPERTVFHVELVTPEKVGERIKKVCEEHDNLVSQAAENRRKAVQGVFNYLIGSQAKLFSRLTGDENDKNLEYRALENDLAIKNELLRQERAKQFTNKEMADQITRDLAVVYGRRHLSIEVSADGKTYRCMRDGHPAENLSEGERNTLALIYFLRHLEDQETSVEPDRRLVVVDDPSTSLDREAVFATHSWLLRLLEKYGQTIILTHDFELLRLFLNSQKNQLTSHRQIVKWGSKPEASKTERANKQAEELYPKVAFLEMHIKSEEHKGRSSTLKPLSETFIKFRSEYHFLFDRLLTGIENPSDHELIFLLPNTARRLLESFVAFHVPERSQFEQQLKKITLEASGEEYRDVYDFCNRFSHGEGRARQLELDATAVSHQILRCLELVHATDQQHFKSMCMAVGRTKHNPLTSEAW